MVNAKRSVRKHELTFNRQLWHRVAERNVHKSSQNHQQKSAKDQHVILLELLAQRCNQQEGDDSNDSANRHQNRHVFERLRFRPRELLHREWRAETLEQHKVEHEDKEGKNQRPRNEVIGFDRLPRLLLRFLSVDDHLFAGGDASIAKHKRQEQEEVNDAEKDVDPARRRVHVDVKHFEEHETFAAEWREDALQRRSEDEA